MYWEKSEDKFCMRYKKDGRIWRADKYPVAIWKYHFYMDEV
jgi:hypothetical protein